MRYFHLKQKNAGWRDEKLTVQVSQKEGKKRQARFNIHREKEKLWEAVMKQL